MLKTIFYSIYFNQAVIFDCVSKSVKKACKRSLISWGKGQKVYFFFSGKRVSGVAGKGGSGILNFSEGLPEKKL